MTAAAANATTLRRLTKIMLMPSRSHFPHLARVSPPRATIWYSGENLQCIPQMSSPARLPRAPRLRYQLFHAETTTPARHSSRLCTRLPSRSPEVIT